MIRVKLFLKIGLILSWWFYVLILFKLIWNKFLFWWFRNFISRMWLVINLWICMVLTLQIVFLSSFTSWQNTGRMSNVCLKHGPTPQQKCQQAWLINVPDNQYKIQRFDFPFMFQQKTRLMFYCCFSVLCSHQEVQACVPSEVDHQSSHLER